MDAKARPQEGDVRSCRPRDMDGHAEVSRAEAEPLFEITHQLPGAIIAMRLAPQ